jgi:uncharacterized membrane protein
MTSTMTRGLLAGAAGTTLLTAATYADMALTGRPPSAVPEQVVTELLRRAGVKTPSDNQLSALAALSGIGTGVALGVVASALRSAGVRLPAVVGAPAIGALAMAATDLSIATLGVSDPRGWTPTDWVRDVVPHLAYGIGVRATLDATERRAGNPAEKDDVGRGRRGRAGLLGRSVLMGIAAGGRSSFGYLAAARLSHRRPVTIAAAAGVATEVVVDKLPSTPSRLEPGPLAGRVAAGAVGGVALARRAGQPLLAPAVVGGVSAVLGSVLGVAWRDLAARRGWTVPGAVVEDVASLALAWAAMRQPSVVAA